MFYIYPDLPLSFPGKEGEFINLSKNRIKELMSRSSQESLKPLHTLNYYIHSSLEEFSAFLLSLDTDFA